MFFSIDCKEVTLYYQPKMREKSLYIDNNKILINTDLFTSQSLVCIGSLPDFSQMKLKMSEHPYCEVSILIYELKELTEIHSHIGSNSIGIVNFSNGIADSGKNAFRVEIFTTSNEFEIFKNMAINKIASSNCNFGIFFNTDLKMEDAFSKGFIQGERTIFIDKCNAALSNRIEGGLVHNGVV